MSQEKSQLSPDFLLQEDIRILATLWHDLYGPLGSEPKRRKRGMSRDDLEDLLVQKEPSTTENPSAGCSVCANWPLGKPFGSRAALEKRLYFLKHVVNSSGDKHDRQMIQTRLGSAIDKNGGHSGHRRDLYGLATGELITWPRTARIVMEVWDARGSHLPLSILVDKIRNLRLQNPEEQVPLVEERDILEDINWSQDHHYLATYTGRIRADLPRTSFEIDYLAVLAAHCSTAHDAQGPVTPGS